MNLVDKFNEKMGFTQTEGRVVIFLVAAFVIGLGIKVVREQTSISPVFNYAAVDSEFAARSARYNAAAMGDERSDSSLRAVRPIPRKPSQSHPLNINTATKEELTLLPGIGGVIAERIVEYRDENGEFESVDGLTNVSGIGKKKLGRIRDYITVGN